MSAVREVVPDIPGWSFTIEEVSAGVYRVRGVDEAGRSVEATGIDPDALMEECKLSAARIEGVVCTPSEKE